MNSPITFQSGNLPTCAICNKPVDFMAINPIDYRKIIQLVVHCHNAIEIVEIPMIVYYSMENIKEATMGLAFNIKLIS